MRVRMIAITAWTDMWNNKLKKRLVYLVWNLGTSIQLQNQQHNHHISRAKKKGSRYWLMYQSDYDIHNHFHATSSPLSLSLFSVIPIQYAFLFTTLFMFLYTKPTISFGVKKQALVVAETITALSFLRTSQSFSSISLHFEQTKLAQCLAHLPFGHG